MARGDSRAQFPTTSWTLIRRLQQLSAAERRELYGEWLRPYWKPLYAFFRSHRRTPEAAADLVQGFWCSFLEGDKILKADQPQKRFRTWLKVLAKNYMLDVARHDQAVKRRPRAPIVSFEQLRTDEGAAYEPSAESEPDDAFADTWRRDLLDRAMAAVLDECRTRGRVADYEVFADYFLAEGDQPTWGQIAASHGLDQWKEAARKADWVKKRLAAAIRREVGRYVETDEEADDEIRDLLQ